MRVAHARVERVAEAGEFALRIDLKIAPAHLFGHAAVVTDDQRRRTAIELGVGGGGIEIGNQPLRRSARRLARIAEREQLAECGRNLIAVDGVGTERAGRRTGDGAQHQVRSAIAADRRVALERDAVEIETTVHAAELQRIAFGDVPFGPQLRGAELIGDGGRAIADFGELEVRRIGDARAEAEQRRAAVGVIELVALRVAIVEHDGGFHRNVGGRLREAAEHREAERVRHILIPAAAELVEFRFRLTLVMLGPHPRVVERAGDEVVLRIVHGVDEVDRTLVGTQQHLRPFLLARFLEARIEAVDRDLGCLRRRPLDAAGDTETLATMEYFAIARDARVEGERRLVARCAGAVEAARIGDQGRAGIAVVEARRAVDRIEPRLRPAHRVVAEFEIVGLLIRRRYRRAERAVGRFVRQQPGEARPRVLAQIVVARLRRQHAGEARLAAQRVAGVEVDDRTERTFVEARLGGLVDDDRVEELGGEDVEVEGAITVR